MPRARKPFVPSEIRAVFVKAIEEMAYGPAPVPDPLPVGTGLRFFWERGHTRNCLLCARVERGERGYFLDYFSSFDDGETSSHGRIHEDGRDEPLENYRGQVSMPVLATPEETQRAHEAIWAHNADVARILRSKGFG